ncbi:MAG: hypothetical protein ACP5I6_02370 [Caldisphaera sp.]|jgi:hypothetical protein|nr:hypothetical protein [Caldisphaera sp.]PMP89221.1 MAG: hypothetical protein C0172_00590 [Caldisphaera sp.]
MNTIIVSSGIYDDDKAIKAAMKAADILRQNYSTTVFVSIENHLSHLEFYNETPKIKIGKNEIEFNYLEEFDSIVNKIIDIVLENINNKLEVKVDDMEINYAKQEPSLTSGEYCLN